MRPGLHTRKSLILLAETAGVFALLLAGAMAALRWLPPGLAWPAIVLLAVAQGLWLDRLYTVAHEAVHLKLFPGRRLANDLVGMALMVPVVAPFTIFRRIHGFHHGGNRRDRSTAALGLPVLVFAWFWSMLLYVYHYRTSVGRDVRLNVRSLPRQPFFS
ncbi:MAG TPA: fatty acid desaturase, partial [Allosphingosinicella sp.]